MKVILNDGTSFEGNSATDIVTALNLDDWTNQNNDDYKTNMVRRVRNFHGVTITYSNDLEFLQELQRINFIRLMTV